MDETEYTPADAVGERVEEHFEAGDAPKQIPPPAQLPVSSPYVGPSAETQPFGVQPETAAALPETSRAVYNDPAVHTASVQERKQELVDSDFPRESQLSGDSGQFDTAPITSSLDELVKEIKGLRADLAGQQQRNPPKYDADGNMLLVDTNPPQNLPQPKPAAQPPQYAQKWPEKRRRSGRHAYASRRPSKLRRLAEEQEKAFLQEQLSRQTPPPAQPPQQTPPAPPQSSGQPQQQQAAKSPESEAQKMVESLQKLLGSQQQQMGQVLSLMQQMSQIADQAMAAAKQNEAALQNMMQFVQGSRGRAMANGRR